MIHIINALVVELVDTADLKSAGREAVPVQVRSGAPFTSFFLHFLPTGNCLLVFSG